MHISSWRPCTFLVDVGQAESFPDVPLDLHSQFLRLLLGGILKVQRKSVRTGSGCGECTPVPLEGPMECLLVAVLRPLRPQASPAHPPCHGRLRGQPGPPQASPRPWLHLGSHWGSPLELAHEVPSPGPGGRAAGTSPRRARSCTLGVLLDRKSGFLKHVKAQNESPETFVESGLLLEAPIGIEPMNGRFAVCGLTTWLRRRSCFFPGDGRDETGEPQGPDLRQTYRSRCPRSSSIPNP